MKQQMTRVLSAVIVSIMTLPSFAYDFEIDGLCYRIISDDQVEVASFKDRNYTGSIIIPETVRHDKEYTVASIGPKVFQYCDGLTSITFGNSIKSIKESAFDGCDGLTSIILGNSLESIGHYAFRNCKELASITFGNSLKYIGNDAFNGCEGLTSITFGNSLKSIGNYAFHDCKGLTSITFGNSLESINCSAFSGCEQLESVTFPSSLVSIHSYAFFGCHKLRFVNLNHGLVNIGDNAFYSCGWFKEIVIPESVRTIGELAFYQMNIENLFLPTTLDKISIGDYGLPSPKNLHLTKEEHLYNVTYSNWFTECPEKVFIDNQLIEDVVIPDEVTNIKDWTLINIVAKESLTIGNGITSIGKTDVEPSVCVLKLVKTFPVLKLSSKMPFWLFPKTRCLQLFQRQLFPNVHTIIQA